MSTVFRSAAAFVAGLALLGGVVMPAAAAAPWLTGTVVTPRNFPDHGVAELTDMFRLDAELGSLAVIRIDWKDPNRLEAVRVLTALAAQRNLKAVVELNPLKADGIKGADIDPPKEADARRLSFANPEVSEPFERAVLELAGLKPPYLAVATDVNLLALSSPGEYSAFTALYRKLYEKIKRASPGTKVFVTFQWEAMQGRSAQANRALVDAVRSHMDLLAFTSDPRKLYDRQGPSGIPGDYYDRMAAYRATREELLVEVTWPTDGGSGETDQLAFVRDLPQLMGGLKPSMLVWSFLHDVKVLVFTLRSGLIETDGKPKPAFAAFRDISGAGPARVAASLPAAGGSPRSRLAQASTKPAHFGVYTARLDGSGMTPLITSDDQEMTHSRVSPDGKQVVITRYNRKGKDGKATEEKGYEDTEIIIMNLDGSGLETIVPGKPGIITANGCWTPDGKSLIYLSTDNPRRDPEILQIDLATRRITRVPTPEELKTTDPHWLGNQIVFPAKGKDADALWIMNADGSRARQITDPPEKRGLFSPGLYGDFDPKLSPDGTKVAFMRIAGGTSWRVLVLDLKTGEERLLTPRDLTRNGVMEWLPTWSGDGKLVLYMHVNLKNLKETGLYTMTPDGRNRKQVPLPRGYMYGNATFFPGDGASPDARIIFTATKNPAL